MVLNLATECLTTAGVEAFKLALQNPNSKLEQLDLGIVNVLALEDENKAAVVALCSALVNNHRLKDVSFGLDQMLFNDGEDDDYIYDNDVIMGRYNGYHSESFIQYIKHH